MVRIGATLDTSQHDSLECNVYCRDLLPSWFVSHSSPWGMVLATSQDIANQPFPIVEAVSVRGRALLRGTVQIFWKAGLQEGPACTNPVAVATVNELVRATRKATLGGILASRKPRNEPWYIKNSEKPFRLEYLDMLSCCEWTDGWMLHTLG